MSNDLNLAARLQLDSQRWVEGSNRGMTATRRFVAGVRREFSELRGFMQSTAGKLAGLGAGFAAGTEIMRSARMDKTLTQIGQTADATRDQVRGLRGELFQMGRDTGQAVDGLQSGFNVLVQSGLNWQESRETLGAINKAMAVTSAQAETLAGTLGVASTAFQFDLSKPNQALLLLDKMTVAGGLGNAELENLGSVFSRVGVNAQRAGFGFDQTLGFIEGLSMIERSPERLATLADSTLRLFTNAKYMKDAQKTTGIRFFDGKTGDRRDPLVVLAEIKKRFDGFKTDAQREGFLAKAFGNADLDTIKGLSTLLTGDNLANVGVFSKKISDASGSLDRRLPEAINNAVDQAGRLKAVLVGGADAFAQRLNGVFAKVTSKLLDKKEDGGMELGAGELAAGAAGSLLALYGGKRLAQKAGGKVLSKLLGGTASLGTGVAMGTALEKAGAATPVFIVGAAPGLLAGTGGGSGVSGAVLGGATKGKGLMFAIRAALAGVPVGALASSGGAGAATVAGGVGLAGAAGGLIGTGMYHLGNMTEGGRRQNDAIGSDIAKMLAFFGNQEAKDSLERQRKYEISIVLDDLRSRVAGIRVNGQDVNATVGIGRRAPNLGRMMAPPSPF